MLSLNLHRIKRSQRLRRNLNDKKALANSKVKEEPLKEAEKAKPLKLILFETLSMVIEKPTTETPLNKSCQMHHECLRLLHNFKLPISLLNHL